MKKISVLFLALVMAGSVVVMAADKTAKAQERAQKEALKAQQKAQKEAQKAQEKHQKELAKELKNKKDVLKDAEYKEIKTLLLKL